MTWQELPGRAVHFFFGTPRRFMWSIIAIAALAIAVSPTLKHLVLNFVGQLVGLLLVIAIMGFLLTGTVRGFRRGGKK